MNSLTNHEPRGTNPEQGYLSILVAVLLVIVTILAVSLTALYMSSMRGAVDRLESAQALGLSEAGLERATFGLLSPFVTSAVALTQRYSCAGSSFSDQSLGAGTFTVNSINTIPYNTSTALTAAMTSSSLVVPVTSIASLATRGRVVIDREAIDYNGTSTSVSVCGTQPCLTGVVRGRDSTTAASHASGDIVSQYQCDISSQGGIPNLTSPRAKRIVKQSVQLQKAWTVGTNSGGAEVIGQWNGAAWVAEGPNASVPNVRYGGVSMLSYADGWAVGDSGNIIHYDGTSWSFFVDTGTTNFNAVYCLTRSNCWAVDSSAKFWNFNGTAWSENVDLGATNLTDIVCVATNDCWAVGASNKFFHWNGTAWSQFVDLGGDDVNGVHCLSASNCWAVGNSGKIYNYNGTAWSEFIDLGNTVLKDVYCASSTHCWAVGASRTFVFYNGTTWSPVAQTVTNVTYNHVACYNTQDCWAVGNSGNIVHYDGTSWANVSHPLPSVNLFGLDLIGAHNRPQSAFLADFY